MRELVYTLVGEGSSDIRLMRPIEWAIAEASDRPFRGQWADRRTLDATTRGLPARLAAALAQFPCDVLFVHRDSDDRDHSSRVVEIDAAITAIGGARYVKVIPVRMQEAWFLFDEMAIRTGVGRPSGREDLDLPPLGNLEALADPKALLREAIKVASERSGRRWRKYSPGEAATRVAELITDYSPLRVLPAFRRLEEDIAEALSAFEAALVA